jgi:hypothetical protein
VLVLTFLLAIGAGVLLLLARAVWRRLSWWRQYHKYTSNSRAAHEPGSGRRGGPTAGTWPDDIKVNGANGADGAASESEPTTLVSGADVSTGR